MAQELVTVASFTTAFDAYLRKNMLEREGVQAFLANELTGDQLSAGYVHDYVKLQVASSDVERARQLLQACQPGGGQTNSLS
jgi:hypothetical protein